jgi:PAS domain S-box-containing protein
MNYYPIISILAFSMCFFMGAFIYQKNSKNELNKMVALLSVLVGFLALVEFLYRQAPNYQTAFFWLKISTIWPFVPSVLLNIALVLTLKEDTLKHKYYYLIYLPAIIITTLSLTTGLLLNGAVHTYWGWTYSYPENPILFNLMSLWTIVAAFTAGSLVFVHYIKSGSMVKIEAKYLFIGLFIPLLLSLLIDLIIPTFYIRVPEMTLTLSSIGIAIISYGIWKYQFPSLTSSVVAEKIVSNMSNFLLLLDSMGKINSINKSTTDLLGYEENELLGQDFSHIFVNQSTAGDLLSPESYDIFQQAGNLNNIDTAFRSKNNENIPVMLSISPIIEDKRIKGLVCIGNDIKDMKIAENEIKESLEDKKVLLREIHHRVKNNLQIISSLLNLQSDYLENEKDKNIFRDSQSRVKSMAIIHEKLYQSSNFSEIDFKGYIDSLTSYLFQSYPINPSKIKFESDIDDITLSMDTAIPCGLIINELVSNSLKYAFPDDRDGKIKIKLKSIDDHFVLEIEDNGIGFPENFDIKDTESLGLKLVYSLTKQIDGQLEILANEKTKFRIIFSEIEYKSRI